MASRHQRTPEIVCLNACCLLLNSGTATVEDGHELLYKKSVFYIVYRYNTRLETSESFLIKNLQEDGKLIDDHSWNREKI
jgi:hypothetical protein